MPIALGPIPRSQIYGSKVMHRFKTFLKSMLKFSLLKKKKKALRRSLSKLLHEYIQWSISSFILDPVQLPPFRWALSTHVSHCIVLCSFSCQHCYHDCSCHEIKNYPRPRNMLYKFESPLYAVSSFPWYRGNLQKH